MNAISLNNLWNYLQGLSLTASNQRWLGERLIEASTAAKSSSVKTTASLRQHTRKLLLLFLELEYRQTFIKTRTSRQT